MFTAHSGVLIFIVKLFQYIAYTENYSSSIKFLEANLYFKHKVHKMITIRYFTVSSDKDLL